jgi:hypothetical protein
VKLRMFELKKKTKVHKVKQSILNYFAGFTIRVRPVTSNAAPCCSGDLTPALPVLIFVSSSLHCIGASNPISTRIEARRERLELIVPAFPAKRKLA